MALSHMSGPKYSSRQEAEKAAIAFNRAEESISHELAEETLMLLGLQKYCNDI